MPLSGNKPWWASKGVWGAVVAVIAGLAGLFGVTLGETEQAELAQLLAAIGAGVGGALALVGRLVARSRIGSLLAAAVLLPLLLGGCSLTGLAETYRDAMERGERHLAGVQVEVDALTCARSSPEDLARQGQTYAALADASPATAGMRRELTCPGE